MNGDFFCGTRDALDYEGLLSLLLPQCFHGWHKRKRRP